ncbi:MAG: hypothetical protein AAGJ97_00080 [Planctomycetota bacterium]
MGDDLTESHLSFKSEISELRRFASMDQSEADTRSKLIDPVFVRVLGWKESHIIREDPVSEGFADYSLSIDHKIVHIEAKRQKPRFKINAPSERRKLKLSGPHLLSNSSVRAQIEQAAKYSLELNTRYAILCNGVQYIVFCTRPHRGSWREGTAYIFHGLNDIEANFSEFHKLLSCEGVSNGSLDEAFADHSTRTLPQHQPLSLLPNPNAELVRNRLWNSIAKTFQPLLAVDPGDEEIQRKIIANCYVSTNKAHETRRELNALLSDTPPANTAIRLSDIPRNESGARTFDEIVRNDIQSFEGRAYVLTGGVGSGKTTFLRRYQMVDRGYFVENHCVWIHVDFLAAGVTDDSFSSESLKQFAYQQIVDKVSKYYPSYLPGDGAEYRDLFSAEIEQHTQTALYGIDPATQAWQLEINNLVGRLSSNAEHFAKALLDKAKRRGKNIAIVLDNTDQLGELVQKNVFLIAQSLSRDLTALTIVAIREEKFFTATRHGVFDAYGDRGFHIGTPDLSQVIEQRLEYGLELLNESFIVSGSTAKDRQEIEKIIKCIIRSTSGNNNIVRMLRCVSNGDVRYSLELFRDFVSSGNTDVDKILNKLSRGGYNVAFHEFAKAAILGQRKYFRNDISRTANIFRCSSSPRSSHFTSLRVLRRLAESSSAISSFGDGFFDISQLLREATEGGGDRRDVLECIGEMQRRRLVETEPPKCVDIDRIVAIRVSASGAYYWQYLVRSFAYLDLVYIDTPLRQLDVAKHLASLADSRELSDREQRVALFLKYLHDEESVEIGDCTKRDTPWLKPLMQELSEQIDHEVAEIRRKFHRHHDA